MFTSGIIITCLLIALTASAPQSMQKLIESVFKPYPPKGQPDIIVGEVIVESNAIAVNKVRITLDPSPADIQNLCGSGRTCVAYYQCVNGTINTAGEGLLDARFGESDDIRYCEGLFETCCDIPNL